LLVPDRINEDEPGGPRLAILLPLNPVETGTPPSMEGTQDGEVTEQRNYSTRGAKGKTSEFQGARLIIV